MAKGHYNYSYAISIDKLEITYTTSEEVTEYLASIKEERYFGENNELSLSRTENRNYCHEFVIRCKDWNAEKGDFISTVGYLKFGSPNPNRKNVYLLFENEALYSWILSTHEYVENTLGLTFKQVSKLDLAVDFNFNIEKRIIKLYKNIDYDLIVNRRKADNKSVYGVSFLSCWNPRHRLFANPQMIAKAGSDSGLVMKTYNKKKEIEQESHKDYIVEKIGFNTTMYRVEITCKNHKLLKSTLDHLDMTDEYLYAHLDNESVLIRLFRHLLDRIIHLRIGRKPLNIIDAVIDDLDSKI